jgi:hypothetical protein
MRSRIAFALLAALLALAPWSALAQTSSGLPAIFGVARPGAGKSSSSSGITIGTTAITGGVSGGELFQTSTGKVGSDSGFTYAGAGGVLTLTPAANTAQPFLITGGSTTGASTSALGLSIVGTLNTSGVVDGAALFANVLNTASGAGSSLVDLQVGSTSQFVVTTNGTLTIGASSGYSWVGKTDAFMFPGSGGTGQTGNSTIFDANTNKILEIGYYTPSGTTGGLAVQSNGYLGFSSVTALQIAPDAFFSRDAAGTVAQKNSTNAQTFRVYNTFTSTTSYERGTFDWNGTSNVLSIGTEKGSGGGSVRNMQFEIGGVNKLDFGVTAASAWSVGNGLNFAVGGTLFVNDSAGAIAFFSTGVIGWPLGSSLDIGFSRNATGIVEVNNGTRGTLTAAIKSGNYIAGGSVPVDGGGTCTVTGFAGGATAGTFVGPVGACAAGTVAITFAFTAPTGWSCDATDRTTSADSIKQTATTATKATFLATLAASDVVQYKCIAY